MKRKLAMLLTFSIVISVMTFPSAYAVTDEAFAAAEALNFLGLFNGTGTDTNGNPIYDLDRTPTRNEAVTMLVRLIGKEHEAKNGEWQTPFNDVVVWAQPYVGYAYANGLTYGMSETTYGGDAAISSSQYLTFILRALGYESGVDFVWNRAWALTDQLGITSGQYGDSSFTRGDIACISFAALNAFQKNSNETLAEKLISEGVFTKAAYDAAQMIRGAHVNHDKLTLNMSYAYIGVGETINLIVLTPGINYSSLSWSSSSEYITVDRTGRVSVAKPGGGASKITVTADNGLSGSCCIMMKSSDVVTKKSGSLYVYNKFPSILSFDNVSPDTPLWTHFDISYPEFGIYAYDYSYLVWSLEEAEKLAEQYARYLQRNGYSLIREEDDPIIAGRDIIYELIDPTKQYTVSIKGAVASVGGTVPAYDVTVGIDYGNADDKSTPSANVDTKTEFSDIRMYTEYNDVPDFASVSNEALLIDRDYAKVYFSTALSSYLSVLEQCGYEKCDDYTEVYKDCQLLTQYGEVSIYRNSAGREVHVLEVQDRKLATTIVFISIDTEIKRPIISEAISALAAQQNPYEDSSCPYKSDFNNYKYGNTDSIYSSPIYVRKSKVDSVKDLEEFLESKYEIIFSPMEDLKVDITIWDNSTSSAGRTFDIHVEFGYVSPDFDVIIPYNFASKYGYTEEQKEETRQLIKEMLYEISQDAIDCFPDATVSGSIFVSGYHYPHIKVGYYSDQTLTWNRIGDDFVWVPSLDTFSLYN